MQPKQNQLWAFLLVLRRPKPTHSPQPIRPCIFRFSSHRLGQQRAAHQGPRTSDMSRPTSPAQARPKPSPKSPNSTPRGSLLSLPLISCHHQIALPQARAPPHRRRCRRLGRSGRPTPTKECPPRPLPSSTTAVRYPPSSPPPSRVASPRAPAARVRAARRRPFLTDRVSFHRHPRGANPPRLVVGRVCPASLCGPSKCPRRGARAPVATEGRNASHTGAAA